MGFSLGSIGKIFSKPVKIIAGPMFGSPDKVKWTDPRRMIAPPSKEESALLGKLYPYSINSLNRSNVIGNMAWRSGLLGSALGQHNRLFGRTLSSLNSIAQGELPDPYKRAINSVFKTQLGGILDQTAKRGIVNSSITQRAVSDALNKTMDVQVNYLPIAAKMSTLPYEFGTAKPLGLFGAFREMEKDYLQYPANLWSTLMTARHGVRAMPIVQKGNSGLLGALAPLGGALLGGYLGGPVGASIGMQAGGMLGNGLSAVFRE
ncbi:hypothetical protein [Persephonella sp.]